MNIVQTSQFQRLLVHSLPVKDTPTLDKEGIQREADDFHPRARLRALHKQKAIIVNNAASIEAFSNIYIIEESLVRDYLDHLKHIEMMSGKRKQEKQTKNQQEARRPCDDFDWYKMLADGTLEKQHVAILNKYIDHYQLLLVRDKNKPEKLRAIFKHLIEQRNNEDESDDDVVFNKIGESSDASYFRTLHLTHQTPHRQTRRTVFFLLIIIIFIKSCGNKN